LTPYILLGRKELPREIVSEREQVYDELHQVWVDINSGEPLVSCMQNKVQPTPFGETMFTRTREGADQTEAVFAGVSIW
jgi:hypothetical protein